MNLINNSDIWLQEVPRHPFETAKTWKIAASAGCGKTFTIERSISDLLAQGVDPEKIMYVLFNKIPAAQFRAKFPKLSDENKKWWGTHHSICKRLNPSVGLMTPKQWDEFSTLYGYRFKVDDDSEELDGDQLFMLYEKAVFNGTRDSLDPKTKLFSERLLGFQLLNQVTDFTSLIGDSMERDLFPDNIEYVFLDEAQDNGFIQHEYWRRVIQTKDLKGFMLVGDDKQAINGFKGGNAEGFLSFECEKQVSLPKSFRCSRKILETANHVIKPVKNRSPLIEDSEVITEGSVRFEPHLQHITLEIEQDVKAGKSTILLARTGQMVYRAQGILARCGIPFQNAHIENVRRVYQAFDNISRTGFISDADYAIIDPMKDSDEKGGLKRRCAYYSEEWKRGRKQQNKDRMKITKTQLSILEDYEKHNEEPVPLFEAHRLGLTDMFIADVTAGKPNIDLFRGGKDIPILVDNWIDKLGPNFRGVQAATIHKMKGSEADTVILVSDISGWLSNKELDQEEDERRTWYVALTRAKTKLIITRVARENTTRFLRF